MDDWIAEVMRELGISDAPNVDAILDVARDAAHAVARPAAPVTTFLMGIAVAEGSDPKAVAELVSRLAQSWPSGTGQ